MSDDLPRSIQISPDAAAYIREKGGAVMLRSTLKHGCCGGRVELVKAEIGSPDADGFECIEQDDILLFAERGLIADIDQSIRIGLDKLFRLEGLYVEGADARM